MVDLDALATDLTDAGWDGVAVDKEDVSLVAYRYKGHIHEVELTVWSDIPSISVRSDGENDVPLTTFGIIARHIEGQGR